MEGSSLLSPHGLAALALEGAPFSLLALAAEHSPDSVVITKAALDPPGPEIVYVNAVFEALLGYTRQEAVGKTLWMFQGPETDQPALAEVPGTSELFRGESTNRHKDGSLLTVRWEVAPVRDLSGHVSHFLAIAARQREDPRAGDAESRPGEIRSRQIPERSGPGAGGFHVLRDLSSEAGFRALARRLGSALEFSDDGMAILNLRGRLEYVNSRLARSRAIAPENAIGRRALKVLCPGLPGEIRSEVLKALRDRQAWRNSYEVLRPDGSRGREETSISPIRGVSGLVTGFIMITRDSTERDRLRSIADAVNMMDHVGYVFSGIRHELGNPVNSIKMALTVLSRNLEKATTQDIQRYVDRISAELARVEFLLHALRSFSVFEHVKLESVDVRPFLQGICTLAKEDFTSRGIPVRVSQGPGNCIALADPRALNHVLLNLLSNAADALYGRPNPEITLSVSNWGRQVAIRVQDNGSGMGREDLENVFRPFYTTKARGTGLGLVIVQKLVTKMNGTISLESQPGAGTVATVLLEPSAGLFEGFEAGATLPA